MQSQVVGYALKSAVECLKIASSGNVVTYQVLTPETLVVSFSVGADNTLHIGGLSHPSDVSCVGANAANSDGTTTYATGTKRDLSADIGAYKITCTRAPSSNNNGRKMYDAVGLAVSTNNGGLNIYWPQNTVLPLEQADQIQANIDSNVSQLQSQITNLAQGLQKLQNSTSQLTLAQYVVQPFSALQAKHSGCNSAAALAGNLACGAAVHRTCSDLGYKGGVPQEDDGNNLGFTCVK
jgi:hypothetical protein